MSATGNNITPAVQKSRSWMTWMILAAFGVVVLSVITYKMATYKSKPSEKVTASAQASIPLASAPIATWKQLTIPPMGKSERITVPPGMHIVMDGNGFLLHNVYLDGSECAWGESCVAGPQAGAYATNEAKETNVVLYAFAPN